MRQIFAFIFITFLFYSIAFSQSEKHLSNEISGFVLDSDSHKELPYANILVLNTNIGAITNEKGFFSINISRLNSNDTLRFQYIGYKPHKVAICDIDSLSTIYLKEEITNLSETYIFGYTLDIKSIVKNILKNRELNYYTGYSKGKVFVRRRSFNDLEELNLKVKKNSFPELSKRMVRLLEEKIPKHTTSFTDFLGDVYFSEKSGATDTLKISPIKIVSLKEKDIAELEQFSSVFENMFKNTSEEEYWKVKSGIFSTKVDVHDEDEQSNDGKVTVVVGDSLQDSTKNISYLSRSIERNFNYVTLNDKDDWEFLYKTGKYNYTLAGGTNVNGEDVYVIDFKPKGGALYVGRMYVSMKTFALIRADYEYDNGKIGESFNLLGISFYETQFRGSIFFEKRGDKYHLKYFSNESGRSTSIDRNFSLLKKRERFMFDKKLNEIKVGFNISVKDLSSTEVLILEKEDISLNNFSDFEPLTRKEIIYVDQFDEKLWEDFPIIEPTQKMREYKKIAD